MGMKRILRWPRFRYSMRTFFIVLTVFGVWLGWQVNIVRERRELLRQLKEAPSQNDDRAFVLGDASLGDNDFAGQLWPDVKSHRTSWRHHSNPVRINFVRRIFGDEGIYFMYLPNSLAEHRKDFMRVFPEAKVYLRPSSELSTSTLIELLAGPHDYDGYDCLMTAQFRAKAIDILAERKGREATPHLIESINDGGPLLSGRDWVGAHTVNVLEEITGHSPRDRFDVEEWKQWWKGQTEDATPQWIDIRSETVSAYWRGLELCVGESSGYRKGWFWIVMEDANKWPRDIARSSEPLPSESSARLAAEAAARKALEK